MKNKNSEVGKAHSWEKREFRIQESELKGKIKKLEARSKERLRDWEIKPLL